MLHGSNPELLSELLSVTAACTCQCVIPNPRPPVQASISNRVSIKALYACICGLLSVDQQCRECASCPSSIRSNMALEQQYLCSKPAEAHVHDVWGWSDVFGALDTIDQVLAHNEPARVWGLRQQEMLGGISGFLRDCREWIQDNPAHAPSLHQLVDAHNVMARISSICARHLQHMHRYRHAFEQMPAAGLACVSLVLCSVRSLMGVAMVGMSLSTAVDSAPSRLKVVRAVTRDSGELGRILTVKSCCMH